MQKKDVLESEKVSSKNLNDALRCGECLHFRFSAHSERGELCSKMGINALGVAPSCYTPDVSALDLTGDQVASLVAALQGTSHKDRRILMALLRNKSKPRESRKTIRIMPTQKPRVYPFGTRVYWRAIGKDYLLNYVSGYTYGYTTEGKLMIKGDPDTSRRGGKSYTAILPSQDGILDYAAWKEKKADLISRNRVHDPDSTVKPRRITQDYEAPTIDTAPAHWFNKGKEREESNRVLPVTEELKNE